LRRERSHSGFHPHTALVLLRPMPLAARADKHLRDSGPGRLPPQRLGDLAHPLPQAPAVGPALAPAFAQLQAVAMGLAGPMAPGQGEPRFDGCALLW
jgi:hypothetical protein